jgi:hypothetical protein
MARTRSEFGSGAPTPAGGSAELDRLAYALARLLLSAWERLPAAEPGREHRGAAGNQQAVAETDVRDVDAHRPLRV